MRRGTSFPWVLVGAGSVVFWTLALGLGIPSFGRLTGVDGAPRPEIDGHRCVATATVDGQAVAFGDCFSVRFVRDIPEFPLPAHVVPYRGTVGPQSVADSPSEETSDETADGASGGASPGTWEHAPPVGQTAY